MTEVGLGPRSSHFWSCTLFSTLCYAGSGFLSHLHHPSEAPSTQFYWYLGYLKYPFSWSTTLMISLSCSKPFSGPLLSTKIYELNVLCGLVPHTHHLSLFYFPAFSSSYTQLCSQTPLHTFYIYTFTLPLNSCTANSVNISVFLAL